MKFTLACVVAVAVCIAAAEETSLEKIFRDARIVPDVLTTAPACDLKITYANELIGHAGNELTPTQTHNAPQLDWAADEDAYYTLLMVTPDAPDPVKPIWREFLRWQVVNVPGTAIEQGVTLCPYLGPTPPQGKGKARYIFSIFQQAQVLTFDEPTLNSSSIAGHVNFNTMKFAEKYALGAPVAGDYFVAQWDESVNAMHKQLAYVFDK